MNLPMETNSFKTNFKIRQKTIAGKEVAVCGTLIKNNSHKLTYLDVCVINSEWNSWDGLGGVAVLDCVSPY